MNNTKFSTFRQFLASFLFLAVLAAFALEEFLVPATILDGGIVGVSMIISQLTPIALGVLTFVLNIRVVNWKKRKVSAHFRRLLGGLL